MAGDFNTLSEQTNSQLIEVGTGFTSLHEPSGKQKVRITANNPSASTIAVTVKIDSAAGGSAKEKVINIPAREDRIIFDGVLSASGDNIYAKAPSPVEVYGEFRSF